jgi:hypothetical protein
MERQRKVGIVIQHKPYPDESENTDQKPAEETPAFFQPTVFSVRSFHAVIDTVHVLNLFS